jgi:hypothetical protein
MDAWKNLKGAPCGLLSIKNRSLDSLMEILKSNYELLESSAPSQYFRKVYNYK